MIISPIQPIQVIEYFRHSDALNKMDYYTPNHNNYNEISVPLAHTLVTYTQDASPTTQTNQILGQNISISA